jgi:hypothetical protein
MDLEKIKQDTKALLGGDADVSYITADLLASMDATATQVEPDDEHRTTSGERVEWTYYGNHVVDRGSYVAFQLGYGSSEQQGCGQATTEWMEKPVSVSYAGYCPEQGYSYYSITKAWS